MKIYIKKGKKSYGIRLPLSAIKLIPGGMMNHIVIKKHDDNMLIPGIDFKELKKAVYLLKEYKGLTIVEVKNGKGEKVIIKI
jgi:hypothetical protein